MNPKLNEKISNFYKCLYFMNQWKIKSIDFFT